MTELLVLSIGFYISAAVGLGFGIFVLSRGPKSTPNQLFFSFCVALAVWQLSFVLGSTAEDPQRAYWFWFFNLANIPLSLLSLTFFAYAIEAQKRYRRALYAIWAFGIAVIAVCIFMPAAYLPEVVPKLYLRHYLVPGPLYLGVMGVLLCGAFLSFVILFAERRTRSLEGQRRIDYYIFATVYGYGTGITAFPLVFNYPVDPILAMLTGTFVVPMVYGMIKKDLLDIRIVARRTVLLTVAISLITALLTGLSLVSNYLDTSVSWFSFWMIPAVAALAATAVGYLYWQKGQEADVLKYEFITIATHKFRTPLTRIRWGTDALLARTDLPPDAREAAVHMREAAVELIELSTLLLEAVRTEKEQYSYVLVPSSLRAITEGVLASFKSAISDKKIALTIEGGVGIPLVRVDKDRISSAIHVLLSNAIAYTPEGGSIRISFKSLGDALRFEITDSGLGLTDKDREHLFTKFFRGERARRADTEGVGVGLSLAKDIIERHRGTLGGDSPGEGKGSTFWFTLPLARGAQAEPAAATPGVSQPQP